VFGENTDFTVQERIMLHLSNYNGFRDHYLNPESVTQEGIAGAVGIARNHVPRALQGLKRGDLVTEATGRVKGAPRRKKVYFLSERGMGNVNALKEKLSAAETAGLDIPEAPGFIGREKEADQIWKALEKGKGVLLKGEAGLGKTYLASFVAQNSSRTRDVMWHSVPAGGSLHGFLRALSEFLGKRGNRLLGYRLGAASAIGDGEVIGLLAGMAKPTLIVIDDLQNADAGLSRFMGVLAAGKPRKLGLLMVTEESFPTLKGLVTVNLAGLDRDSVMKALGPRGDIDGFCDIAVSNPLFLKLAAHGPQSGLEDFLSSEFASMPDEERRAMWAISLFEGPVALEMLAAVGKVDYQVAVNLAGRGLLRELGNGTFDTHKLLREYFLTTMPESEGRGMHLRAARKLAEGLDPRSMLEAQRHLLAGGAGNECARSIAATGVKIINKGLRRELEEILGLLDKAELDESLRAEVLLLRGYAAKLRGEWESALGDYGKALDIFTGIDLREKMADAQAKIGRVHLEQGKYDTATEHFNTGMGLLGQEPDIVRTRILDEMATIHLRKREIEEARAKVGKAMEQVEKLGDSEMEARIHNTMGNLHMTVGSLSEAKEHYELSLEGLKDVDEQMALVLCNNLAIIEFKSGNVDRAIELWETAAGKAEAMKSLNVMLTFSNLGSIHFSIGNWDRAAECCAKALEISEMVGKHNITAASESTLGHIALYRKEEAWLDRYKKAMELRAKLGDAGGIASSHNDMARGFVLKGEPDEAVEHSSSALALAREKKDSEEEARALLNLADALAAKDKFAEAKANLKQALLRSREIKNNEMNAMACLGIGRISALEGEDFAAEKYFEEAVNLLEKARRPLQLAIALYEHGALLRDSGLGEPEECLKRSRESFRSLGLDEKPWFLRD